MSQITSILLIPTEAHREALIGDGPCGSRAPVAVMFVLAAGRVWCAARPDRPCVVWHGDEALVLAWDGKPVADGLARLGPYFLRDFATDRTSIAPMLDWARLTLADPNPALSLAPLGRIVLLDADGREVAQ